MKLTSTRLTMLKSLTFNPSSRLSCSSRTVTNMRTTRSKRYSKPVVMTMSNTKLARFSGNISVTLYKLLPILFAFLIIHVCKRNVQDINKLAEVLVCFIGETNRLLLRQNLQVVEVTLLHARCAIYSLYLASGHPSRTYIHIC